MAPRLTPRAQRDVDEIWHYSVEHWGTDRAERYIQSIRDAIARIAEAPDRGQSLAAVRPGYRKYPVGSHCLCYRQDDEGVVVVRILHQRMDIASHLR